MFMVQVEVGRRPRAQTKAPFPRVYDGSAAESPGCFCAVSRTLALPGDHLQTRRSGRRRRSCSAHSETSLHQSALSLIWLLIGQKHETVCWLREKKSERRLGIIPNLETNAGQRFSNGVKTSSAEAQDVFLPLRPL